ncbi:MAG: MATE family efflux transporter [Victivallales bacterium]|nr:MATE family efflux transporter [Victivallales bacterium]
MIKDMTQGNPLKLILLFSIPLLIGNAFQQLYNVVDTLIVGRTLGANPLASVGAVGALVFAIIGFCFGMSSGFGVIIGQRFGAKDEAGLRRSVTHSAVLSVIATIILTAICVPCTRTMLRAMRTPPELLENAVTYLRILFIGLGATFFYNTLSAIIRALGDSRTPLYFLILSSVVNILLDLLFILHFGMGVAGAAWATVLSQLLSALCCLWFVSRHFPILRLRRSDWQSDNRMYSDLLKQAIPMGFHFSIIALGAVILQVAVNDFGPTAVAGITIANKISLILSNPLPTFGIALGTFVAQNYGAQQFQRIRQGITQTLFGLSLPWCLIAGIICYFGDDAMTQLFLKEPDAEVLRLARIYFQTVVSFYFAIATMFVYRNVMQSVGLPLWPLVAAVIELLGRMSGAVILPKFIGYRGVCLSSPLAWIGACVILIPAYYLWSHRKNIEIQKR